MNRRSVMLQLAHGCAVRKQTATGGINARKRKMRNRFEPLLALGLLSCPAPALGVGNTLTRLGTQHVFLPGSGRTLSIPFRQMNGIAAAIG